MWKLVIEDDEGKRTVVPLTRDDYTIGRQEGNTIRLTERNVSRQHSLIRRRRQAPGNGAAKEGFFVEDRQSYNGVFVNGLRVAHIQDLQHGDLIQIGDYRIVLQDDAAAVVDATAIPVTTTEPTAKTTMPTAAFRSHTLTERPNRLVMLVGPTPGVEFPLVDERMTVGRAEDASISVNHNSVSRLHCEIHSLGDGRFEIVDKGSSNGVRVNGVELRRSIIEAGDVIELGDVRFKFVGKGQVFVPGPNESQQLAAISDREAELVDPKARGLGGYMLPVVAAGILGAGLILGFVMFLKGRGADSETVIVPAVSPEETLVMEAKKGCTIDECEAAFQRVSTSLPAKSAWRDSTEFRFVVTTWADSLLKKAQAELDPAVRRTMLQRVANEPLVDAQRRKQANDALPTEELAPAPSQVPVATRDAATTVTSAVVNPPPPHPPRPPLPAPPTPAVTSAATVAPTPKQPGTSNFEKAIVASREGRAAEVRQLLEGRVRGGHASTDEARLVREACKAMQDYSCRDDINAKYPQLMAPR